MKNQAQIPAFGNLVGRHPSMKRVAEAIDKVAGIDAPVLIAGETGTGKDLVAHEIHQLSARAEGPFVAVNMGMLTQELVASELFGHRKGAFTGAAENKQGRFAESDGGTLFLDEIATMDESAQVALLRVLDTGAFRPLGAKRDVKVDTRLIAATNVDLRDASTEGEFRDDLIHRLEVFRIDVPPLRERRDDIEVLTLHFLSAFRREFNYPDSGITNAALDLLNAYDWPGNVRELKNVIAQAVVNAERAAIDMSHLPARIRSNEVAPRRTHEDGGPEQSPSRTTDEGMFIPFGKSLDEVQKDYVLNTLERCGNNKAQTARELGISRKTLYSKLDRWNCR